VTTRTHTNNITSFVMKEISLVPEGDNPEAHVLIAKRRAPGGGDATAKLDIIIKSLEASVADGNTDAAGAVEFLKEMGGTMTDIEKQLAEITKQLEKLAGDNTELTAEIAKLKGEITGKDGEIAKLKGEAAAAGTDEDVLKNIADPATRAMVEKSLNAAAVATAALNKMRDEAEAAGFITKAKATGIGDAEALGGLMQRIAKGTTTDADVGVLEGVLKAAGEREKALFRPIGQNGSKIVKTVGGGEAEGLLQAAADAIHKAKPNITKEQAYSEAMDANPALYDQYLAETRA
jgi:regulator of replication initiation timing